MLIYNIKSKTKPNGFSLVEILLAVAIFAVFGTIMLSAFIYGRDGVRQAGDRVRATELANSGVEVVRNIANPNYSNLSAFSNGTNYYISSAGNQWLLTTTPQLIDSKYTRIVTFSDGPNGSRKVNVTVSWPKSLALSSSTSVNTYFANWRQPTSSPIKSGLFVYADGGLTTDKIEFKQLQTGGSWTSAILVPDISTTTTNRVPRSLKLYSAQTGSAKMMVSRHYDGTKQYMYATAWNGSSWSNPQLLAQWTSSAALNSGNYGGDFLADGSFVAVYSDGSNNPKSRSYNGVTWGPEVSLGSIGSSSNYITAMMIRARQNSNDMMTVFLTQDSKVNTSFYANSAWQPYTLHTASSAGNGSLLVDFDWSSVSTNQGTVLYTTSSNTRALRAQTFTVNGSGSGTWGGMITSSNIPSGQNIVSVRQISRPNTANELVACAKSDNNPGSIYCFEINPSGSGFVTPANNVITNNTDYGGQITFDVAYKYVNSNDGVIAYSDNTKSGKLKIYNSSVNSWTTTPISLTQASQNIGKTRIVGRPNADETMVMVSDANRNLYSVVLDGTTNTLFTTPSGKAWTNHLSSGPTNDAVWFDFAWDN